MIIVAIFASLLFLAVLLSEVTERSVLSAAVLFLLAGFLCGKDSLGIAVVDPKSNVVVMFTQISLFAVLFTDGMKLALHELRTAWRLPGRALLFGMPLVLLSTAILARWLMGLSWAESLLVAAVLSPTDPVFASAIVGRKNVPHRLRHLLNVESGLNDGLALPIVVFLLAYTTRGSLDAFTLAIELVGGVALGVVVPWMAAAIERIPIFNVTERYRPFFALSCGILLFAIASLAHCNLYLAAFVGGMTLNSVRPQTIAEFRDSGERLTELLKLASLLLFGALISPRWFGEIGAQGIAFVLLALLVARPVSLELALLGSSMDWKERLVAGWFGPRGFAAVVYGILVLKSSSDNAPFLFHLIALVVAGSIIAHSSTDILVARWLEKGAHLQSSPEN